MSTWGNNPVPFLVRLFIFAPIFEVVALGASALALVVIHFIGEEICNALAKRGVELRPRDRK